MELTNFLKHLSKLDNVHQWEERDSIIKESVSQHSFKVSAIAHYLLRAIENEIREVNFYGRFEVKFLEFKSESLSYAILHDFDEAIIGRDISHVVKYNPYNGDKIREAINDFVNHQETMDFQGLLPKPTEIIKKFVKICDWIALSTFCERNNQMGCLEFNYEIAYCRERLRNSFDEFVNIFNEEFSVDLSKVLNKTTMLKWH